MKNILLAALALLALAGCSSDPYAIKPNPVPSVKSSLTLNKLWSHDSGAGLDGDVGVHLRPAVTAKAVFAADVHGQVVAYDRKSGKRLWRVKTGYRISGGLYADYGKVLFGTRDAQAVALDAKTGKPLWRTGLSSEVLSPPASDGNTVVYQTQDGRLIALSMDSGKELWSYGVTVPSLSLRGTSSPLIDGSTVYAGFASGKVEAVNLSDGSPVWEQQVAEPTGRSQLDRLVDIDNNLILDNGGLFAATYQGKVAVMDVQQGQPFWGKDMSTYTHMSNRLGSLFICNANGNVVALDERSGKTLWKQTALHGRRPIGTVIQDSWVVVGDDKGYLYWLSPDDGHLLAMTHFDSDGFAGTPVVFDGVLYVMGENGKLAAYKVSSSS